MKVVGTKEEIRIFKGLAARNQLQYLIEGVAYNHGGHTEFQVCFIGEKIVFEETEQTGIVHCKDCNAYTPTGPGTGVCPALGGVAEYDGCTMGDRQRKKIKHANVEVQWIDVSKRLPEDAEPVLIVERFKVQNGEYRQSIKTGQYCHYSGENKEWVYFAEMKDAEITHWAELPQLPEAGDLT